MPSLRTFATSLLALLVLASLSARATEQLVVVLPIDVANAKIEKADRIAFEEEIRTIAGDALTPMGYTVLTGETTLRVLADNGIDGTKACESSCALETAKELKAQLFVSGTVTTSEGAHVAFVRLFDSASGKQLNSVELEGKTVHDLRAQFKQEASSFFAKALGKAAPRGEDVTEGHLGGGNGDFRVESNEVLVHFDSTPPGAVVMIDGALRCQSTPCAKSVEGGTHEVTMQKENYDVAKQKAKFEKGATIALTLEATFATLDVETDPPGLPLQLDGKSAGRAPLHVELAPGGHEVLVDDACSVPAGERISLKKGEKRALTVTAKPREAGLKISAEDEEGNALEADVTLDGKSVGTAPGTFKVPACGKSLEVTTKDGGAWSGDAKLRERETTTVVAKLARGLAPTPGALGSPLDEFATFLGIGRGDSRAKVEEVLGKPTGVNVVGDKTTLSFGDVKVVLATEGAVSMSATGGMSGEKIKTRAHDPKLRYVGAKLEDLQAALGDPRRMDANSLAYDVGGSGSLSFFCVGAGRRCTMLDIVLPKLLPGPTPRVAATITVRAKTYGATFTVSATSNGERFACASDVTMGKECALEVPTGKAHLVVKGGGRFDRDLDVRGKTTVVLAGGTEEEGHPYMCGGTIAGFAAMGIGIPLAIDGFGSDGVGEIISGTLLSVLGFGVGVGLGISWLSMPDSAPAVPATLEVASADPLEVEPAPPQATAFAHVTALPTRGGAQLALVGSF